MNGAPSGAGLGDDDHGFLFYGGQPSSEQWITLGYTDDGWATCARCHRWRRLHTEMNVVDGYRLVCRARLGCWWRRTLIRVLSRGVR